MNANPKGAEMAVPANSLFFRHHYGAAKLLLALFVAAILVSTATPVCAAKRNNAPAVGSKAPPFELSVQGDTRGDARGGGTLVTLSDLAKDGPFAVIVLRGFPGYQCGICKQQVGALINRAKSLSSVTGSRPRRIVLIYPGPANGLDSKAKAFLGSRRLPDPFVLLKDPGMEMVTEWGLRWDKRSETAYPAAFIIDGSKRVRWAKVSDSHSGRAGAEELIKAFKNL